MRFSFYMARRYLFSKKSHNLIHIISWVSMIGLAIGTAALIIVLSVFNGFEQVISSLYNSFDPDFTITAVQGKTFQTSGFPMEKIKQLHGISEVVQVVEEDALFKYGDRQTIGKIMGLSPNFMKVSRLDTMMQAGDFVLQTGKADFAVAGAGVAWFLGINVRDTRQLLTVFIPRRGNASSFNFRNAFNSGVLPVSGIFSVQQDFDEKYVLVPLRFARDLLNYTNQVTSLHVYIKKGVSAKKIQKEIETLAGKNFVVKNRFEQNETLYKIMKSEKMAVFLILVFILILSSFSMIGSVAMFIVEKVKDIAVLRTLGVDMKTMRTIFLRQGILISLLSAFSGLFIGFIILWLQQQYGFIKLGSGNGGFIINAYPVQMRFSDFFYVFITVFLIGWGASWYPVHFLLKKEQKIKLA
ncbi:ABC transporter permease [Candidatus Sulfidibacterium hydrothermale]|uniref:ABC transporter permease n=1 Tax=Candidatus Sulfidibacterium hydrothermale TaxID=2875962 RepID=UPI001F0A111C|nr:ABC transporter permease [Candidatus Sulfidibacterium hydrothermale]UBM63223.1 ABC transporter permease [Candidatus Sulfidibacterium hydrothermale]